MTDFSEYFVYDPSVPSCLRRLKDSFSGRNYTKLSAKAGDAAGTKIYQGSNGKPSAYKVKLHGKSLMCHRVVWELFNGKIPSGYMIDHIDRNPFNNLIENLRLVRSIENNQNRSVQSNNNTGVTGVYWSVTKGNSHCQAAVIASKKVYTKSFSVNKYGLLPSFKMAVEWREKTLKFLVEQGQYFTSTHGKV